MAVAPLGLIAFLLAIVAGIASNVIELLFAITVIYRALKAAPTLAYNQDSRHSLASSQ